LSKAHELSPNKQTILFEIGIAYLSKGDTTNALKTFKTAFDLAPEDRDARLIYGISAIYAKQFQLSNTVLAPLGTSTILNDDRIVQAYYAVGQYQKMVEIWKSR